MKEFLLRKFLPKSPERQTDSCGSLRKLFALCLTLIRRVSVDLIVTEIPLERGVRKAWRQSNIRLNWKMCKPARRGGGGNRNVRGMPDSRSKNSHNLESWVDESEKFPSSGECHPSKIRAGLYPYIHIYIYIYICIYYVFIYIYIYMLTYIYIYIYMYTHTHMYHMWHARVHAILACLYAQWICVCIYIYIHIHIHTYIHTYTYIHI